ncbi:thiol peroxidase [Mycoplasma sp. 128]
MQVKFKGNNVTLEASQLKVGDSFPEFVATNLDLSDFSSADLKGQKRLIFSIPSIDTGVCEMETTRFMNEFKSKPNPVVVISMDLPFALNRWCAAKNNEKVVTVSDFKYRDFSKKTGTRIAELGLLTRAVFVVDENDKVVHVEYCQEVSSEPNYEEVMKFF